MLRLGVRRTHASEQYFNASVMVRSESESLPVAVRDWKLKFKLLYLKISESSTFNDLCTNLQFKCSNRNSY